MKECSLFIFVNEAGRPLQFVLEVQNESSQRDEIATCLGVESFKGKEDSSELRALAVPNFIRIFQHIPFQLSGYHSHPICLIKLGAEFVLGFSQSQSEILRLIFRTLSLSAEEIKASLMANIEAFKTFKQHIS